MSPNYWHCDEGYRLEEGVGFPSLRLRMHFMLTHLSHREKLFFILQSQLQKAARKWPSCHPTARPQAGRIILLFCHLMWPFRLSPYNDIKGNEWDSWTMRQKFQASLELRTQAHMRLKAVICQHVSAELCLSRQLGTWASTTDCALIYKFYRKGIIKEQFNKIYKLTIKMPV